MADFEWIRDIIVHQLTIDVDDILFEEDAYPSESASILWKVPSDEVFGWKYAVRKLIYRGLVYGQIASEELSDSAPRAAGESNEPNAQFLISLKLLMEDLGIQIEDVPEIFLPPQQNFMDEDFRVVSNCRKAWIKSEVDDALEFLIDLLSPNNDPSWQYLSNLKTNEKSRNTQNRTQRGKHPKRYKGLKRSTPDSQGRKKSKKQPYNMGSNESARVLPIEVRLRFDGNGSCNISLIAKRSEDLPCRTTVTAPFGEFELQAKQNEWYLDFSPENVSNLLREGTVWVQKEGGHNSWSLGGRELYVLAARNDISGYCTTSSLEINRNHAVLFHKDIEDKVYNLINATGAVPEDVLRESHGLPSSWVLYTGVIPSKSVRQVGGNDVFNALRPIPQIRICLKGGVRLERQSWLNGYPPNICIIGNQENTVDVLIDGHPATCDSNAIYRVAGCDEIGSHTIWCEGKRKTYIIKPMSERWDVWDAHKFPTTVEGNEYISICGPLTRIINSEHVEQIPTISVPDTNPVLLGSVPGEVFFAKRVSDVAGSPLIATPTFYPIWALPINPLRCDKSSRNILLIDTNYAQQELDSQEDIVASNEIGVDMWYRLILDASRKGLLTEPDDDGVKSLWSRYKSIAQNLRRSFR